jgi:CubicO group peptidase (beta-lactamase class C family)
MVDTEFHVPEDKVSRFSACYAVGVLGSKVVSQDRPTLQDDPRTSPYLKPPTLVSGGGGLVSTAADYLRFSRMLLQGGELDGVRLLGPKTLALMTANHLPGGQDIPRLSRSMFSEATYDGVGFGLGFATTVTPASTLMPGSAGDFFWGGAASTFFWVDPQEDLIGVFLTQLLPSSAFPVRRQLRTLVYSAITEPGPAARGRG